jgi:hypothetical protein
VNWVENFKAGRKAEQEDRQKDADEDNDTRPESTIATEQKSKAAADARGLAENFGQHDKYQPDQINKLIDAGSAVIDAWTAEVNKLRDALAPELRVAAE